MPRPGPNVTSDADTQPGSDSLFPTGFSGGGALVRSGSVGTGEIADGSVAAADLNLASVAAAIAARSEMTGTYAGLVDSATVAKTVTALRPFHIALANRDIAPCDLLIIGDSFTEGGGTGAVTDRNRRYTARLRDLLRSRYPVSGVGGGEGYVPTAWTSPGGVFAMPAPATITGSPVVQGSWGFGKHCYTLTTGQGFTWTVTGTSVDIHYVKGTSTGVMAVSVDSGTATTYATVNAGGTADNGVQRVSLGSAGSHTVNVSWSSGGTVYLNGIMVYNGDESAGVRMTESGHWGWKSSDWSQNGSQQLTYLAQRVTVLQPALIAIGLGVNDYGGNIDPAVFQTNMQTLITTLGAACTVPPSFVLIDFYQRQGAFTYPWSGYNAAFKALEAANANAVHFDFSARVPLYNTDATLVASDLLHPNEKGHGYIAATLARFLEPR